MSQDEEDELKTRARARVGQVLREKWKLDRLLGVGGMASVYAASHRNGKRGAVKMLHAELSASGETRARFLREGYVANKVDHPGAVSVLDDDVHEGTVFLVMELLEGETVEARAAARPDQRLSVAEVVAIGDALLDVLAAAHDKGIVHRDLKPENLFLTTRGELKVLDFGIARLRDTAAQNRGTRTGSVMGTPAFMPPEQALGNTASIDGRTDLWAAGATLFTLLAGRLVHQADTLNKLLLAAMTRPAPPLASVVPGAPPALAAVIDRALAFDQAVRWPDARAMRDALRAAAPVTPAVLVAAVAAAPVTGAAPGVTASGTITSAQASAPGFAAFVAAVTAPTFAAPSAPSFAAPGAPSFPPQTPPVAFLTPGPSPTTPPFTRDASRANKGAGPRRAVIVAAIVLGLGAVAGGLLAIRGAASPDPPPPGTAGPTAAAITAAPEPAPPAPSAVPIAPVPSVAPTPAPSAAASTALPSPAEPPAPAHAPRPTPPSRPPAVAPPKKSDPFGKY